MPRTRRLIESLFLVTGSEAAGSESAIREPARIDQSKAISAPAMAAEASQVTRRA